MALFKKRKLSASKDFDKSMLPHSRKEIFFDVIKLHWKSFILYGLLSLLFLLPLFIVSLAEQVLVWQQYSLLEGLSDQEKLDGLTAIYSLQNTAALFKIPCYVIVAMGLAGFIKVIRQYAWEENVFFSIDFSSGVKSNGKQFVLLSLIVGVVNFLVTYSSNMSNFSSDTFTSILMMLPIGVAIFVVVPIVMYAMVSISLYANKFGTVLSMSFMLTAKTIFKTILALSCCFAPLALLLIPNLVVQFVVRLIYGILIPTILLGWYLFALNQFDKYVNQKHYPHLVGRGIEKNKPNSTEQDADTSEIA